MEFDSCLSSKCLNNHLSQCNTSSHCNSFIVIHCKVVGQNLYHRFAAWIARILLNLVLFALLAFRLKELRFH